MTFAESLDWLNGSQRFGIKLGLENTRRLLDAVGNPETRLEFLHVAGTNGKGSVCAMMDAVLRRSGRRVGLFTSPHLVDFRERIRVDGEWIGEADVTAGLTRLREAAAEWDHAPTYFELVTVLGLMHFAESAVDVVVLETGMGGRLDATNVVVPRVSVITPIAMDHAEWLGADLAAIAGEKAGIIKPGVPVVSAEQVAEAGTVIRRRAEELGATVEFVEVEVPNDWEVGLVGRHQRRNAAVAVAALRVAGFRLEEAVVRVGVAEVRWAGRFERVGDVVLDGAHNVQGAAQLVRTWREEFGDNSRVPVIFGALRDKDYGEILRELEGVASEFLFVPVGSDRGAEPGVFGAEVGVDWRVFGSVGAALGEVVRQPPDGIGTGAGLEARHDRQDACAPRCLVCGSLFLVGEALALLAE